MRYLSRHFLAHAAVIAADLVAAWLLVRAGEAAHAGCALVAALAYVALALPPPGDPRGGER